MIKKLRIIKDWILVNSNKFLGREFIPNVRENLYIEPTSVCNFKCVFCAFSKKKSPRVTMKNTFFFDIIEQALDFGYDTFGLTPLTGEIFADKRIFEKLDYLENNSRVKRYHFFTNFSLLDNDEILRLLKLKKLSRLSISLYGHDKESFLSLTRSTLRFYDKIVSNLKYLLDNYQITDKKIEVYCRTAKSFDIRNKYESELTELLKQINENLDISLYITKEYVNWGGLILQDDVKDYNIDMIQEKSINKKGACTLILHKFIVMADGRVNACACSDVNATLCIGDLNKQAWDEIISVNNKKYMKLIDDQQNNRFPPVCDTCTNYSSIYRKHYDYKDNVKPLLSLKQFYNSIK